MSTDDKPKKSNAELGLVCDGCGDPPDQPVPWGTEPGDAGQFEEDGVIKFICYPCWCRLNYGSENVLSPAKPCSLPN